MRTKHAAGRLNESLGKPSSTSKFEYIEISLSKDAIIRMHMDYKNDG
jgi:hypothetical protein